MVTIATESRRKAPTRNQKGWISVDIGTATVKISQVERRAGRWRLCFGQVLPIAADRPLALEELHSTLKIALRGSVGWYPRAAACLLPWSTAELRMTELPAVSDEERDKLVAAEAADSGRGDSQELQVTHWQSSLDQAADRPGSVHILTVPTDTASAGAALLSAAKLDCRVIDARPFALARAVAMSADTRPAETVAAIDWGLSQVAIVLVRGGRPYFTRILEDDGLRLVLEQVERGLKLNRQESSALLRQFSLDRSSKSSISAEVNEALFNLTRGSIEHTVDELKRTLTFASQQQQRESAPTRIVLFGGGATIQGVDKLLTKELGLPTQLWSLNSTPARTSHEQASEPLLGESIALSAIPLW